jgi:hypothetical protein
LGSTGLESVRLGSSEQMELGFDFFAGFFGQPGFGGGGFVEFSCVGGEFGTLAVVFEGGFGEFREGVEDASVVRGILGELVHEVRGIEIGQEIVHLFDGDADAGLVDLGGVRVLEDVAGEVKFFAQLVEPVLFLESIFVPAGMPV